MANLTVSEWHLSIRHKHAIAPALTAEDIEAAIKSALITKLGWHVATNAIEDGDLTIVVS